MEDVVFRNISKMWAKFPTFFEKGDKMYGG